jgi:DNA-binding transcriptional ArsR family regulator
MPDSKINLVFHPIRLRIITTLSARRMTAQDMAVSLPDVPLTTLYRHINVLVESGLLRVVEEHQIRGTVERVYALAGSSLLSAEDLKGMSPVEYEEAFSVFLASLLADAQTYLASQPEGSEINPIADGVDVSKIQLYLSDEEYRQINLQLVSVIMNAAENQPKPGRKRRVFSYIFIPVEG